MSRTVVSTATVGLLVAGFAGCSDQPKPSCITSVSAFAVKLIEKARTESVTGACTGLGPASFRADPEAGIISYYQQDSKMQVDYAKGSVAIQTAELGTLVANARDLGASDNMATDGKVYSLGPYSVSQPDANDICPVPTLSPTHVVLAAVAPIPDDPTTPDDDESFAGQDAQDITLTWSDMRVYVTAASFGTQVQADVVDKRVTPAGTCTINYRAVGLAPAIPCGAPDPMTGMLVLDPVACEPEANPAEGRFIGSGISPNTKFTCDQDSGFCVLDSETVPALR